MTDPPPHALPVRTLQGETVGVPAHVRPGYWMHETSGVLAPAMRAYMLGGEMTDAQIAAVRAYLRQWIEAPAWRGAEIDELRRDVDGLSSSDAISAWLDRAIDAGIDPL